MLSDGVPFVRGPQHRRAGLKRRLRPGTSGSAKLQKGIRALRKGRTTASVVVNCETAEQFELVREVVAAVCHTAGIAQFAIVFPMPHTGVPIRIAATVKSAEETEEQT